MTTYQVSIRVEAGKVKLRDVRAFNRGLGQLPDGEYLLTVEKAHATRSLQANAFYWGVVIEAIARHTEQPAGDIHEFCKQQFLPKKLALADKNGEIHDDGTILGGSTTKLNKVEFYEYCEQIRAWALDFFGLDIPTPDQREAA